MKREEKHQQMRRRIMDSALAEFSGQGYGASSVNTICSAQGISKGIIYHYFKTKDELFLALSLIHIFWLTVLSGMEVSWISSFPHPDARAVTEAARTTATVIFLIFLILLPPFPINTLKTSEGVH